MNPSMKKTFFDFSRAQGSMRATTVNKLQKLLPAFLLKSMIWRMEHEHVKHQCSACPEESLSWGAIILQFKPCSRRKQVCTTWFCALALYRTAIVQIRPGYARSSSSIQEYDCLPHFLALCGSLLSVVGSSCHLEDRQVLSVGSVCRPYNHGQCQRQQPQCVSHGTCIAKLLDGKGSFLQ